jgi:hypothetical protein
LKSVIRRLIAAPAVKHDLAQFRGMWSSPNMPARMGLIRSPVSARLAARESTQTLARRTVSPGISCISGVYEPMALM